MTKKSLVFITIGVLLCILGALITPHFGESWDELKFYKYADLALRAYSTWPTQGHVAVFGNTYDSYGPAFVMFVTLAARPLQMLFTESDARHYVYFLTSIAGVWAFHKLAKRWLAQKGALFAAILFATQPLLLGHAFISPKDVPFLCFMLLTLHFGLRLFDSPGPIQTIDLDRRPKRTLFVLSALWLVAMPLLFFFTDALHTLITNLVLSAKAGEVNVVSRLASDLLTTDPVIYIQRYFVLFLRARSFIFLLLSLLVAFSAYRFLPRHVFRSLLSVLFPAILLGLTTSIRLLGPFAAVFITYYALRKHGKLAILPLSLYAVIAIITTYLTWPYLWPNPLGHLIESLLVMSQYPWNGQVLFNGAQYASTNLPYSYLPVLFSIQFTEPVWVLTLLGVLSAFFGSREKRELLVFTMVWFVVPLIGFIVTRSPLYDNFRQIFFIVPPVFMLAGVIFERIHNVKWQVVLMVLCLLPGIIDAIRLHPYEYIYYNRLAGGVHGAFRRFELDYWGTSYREAAGYLKDKAPKDAAVWVDGPAHIFELYARKDIKVYSDYEAERAEQYDYVVSTSRYNLDITSYPEARVVYAIEREGATLTVIKQP